MLAIDRQICPKCNKNKLQSLPNQNYLSMLDNKTFICLACARDEAFDQAGLPKKKTSPEYSEYIKAI